MNVRRTIEVALDRDEAFALFTAGIGEWWPLRQGFSYGADRCDSIHLEATPEGASSSASSMVTSSRSAR